MTRRHHLFFAGELVYRLGFIIVTGSLMPTERALMHLALFASNT